MKVKYLYAVVKSETGDLVHGFVTIENEWAGKDRPTNNAGLQSEAHALAKEDHGQDAQVIYSKFELVP